MKSLVLATASICCIFAQTPTSPPANFDQWVEQQIATILDAQTVGQNGQGADKQRQSPSVTSRSTSLVDQSSSTDFVSVAASLIPVASAVPSTNTTSAAPGSSGSTSSDSGSGAATVTSTLFALLSAFNGTSPTDPTFYKDHVDARRLSFTVGTAASTLATDNSNTLAKVVGAKFLVLNGRELYKKDNLDRIRDVQDQLSKATATGALLKRKILQMIFTDLHPDGLDQTGNVSVDRYVDFLKTEMDAAHFQSTLGKVSATTKKGITDLLTLAIEPFSALRKGLQDTYDSIQKGRQLSVAYTANIRSGNGNNDHKAELLFDYGLSPRINWTLNADGEYTERKMTKDSRGGSVATQFTGNLTKPNYSWGRFPLTLSVSVAARWMSLQKPQYTFQTGLTIPISVGLDLPIVYRYANRTALLNQTSSEASLGLSIDLSRLTHSLK